MTNIRNFFGGFVEVANGLTSILSLGYLAPGRDFRYYCWRTLGNYNISYYCTAINKARAGVEMPIYKVWAKDKEQERMDRLESRKAIVATVSKIKRNV